MLFDLCGDVRCNDAYDGVRAANGDSPIDMPLDQDEDPGPIVVQFTV